jgi:hypothetical protein
VANQRGRREKAEQAEHDDEDQQTYENSTRTVRLRDFAYGLHG